MKTAADLREMAVAMDLGDQVIITSELLRKIAGEIERLESRVARLERMTPTRTFEPT